MAAIPQSVRDMVQMHPVEDILLPLFREAIPDVPFYSQVPDKKNPFPFVMVRRSFTQMHWRGQLDWLDMAHISVETFTQDVDGVSGDEQGAVLSEACRVALLNFWQEQEIVPGRGHIVHVRMINEPRRINDWSTSTGPVQYADLPTDVWRYETIYRLTIRPPITDA